MDPNATNKQQNDEKEQKNVAAAVENVQLGEMVSIFG